MALQRPAPGPQLRNLVRRVDKRDADRALVGSQLRRQQELVLAREGGKEGEICTPLQKGLGVDFEDESQFREQIGTIKESYFSSNEGQKKTPKVDLVDSEIVEEDGNQSVSPRMAAYRNVIRKTVENY